MWLSKEIAWIETELQSSGVSLQQYGYVALKIASDLINGGTKEAILADVLSLFGSVSVPAGARFGISDADKQDAINKLTALVTNNFGGDQKAAFDHYATNGLIGTDGIKSLLADAGIGNWLDRGFIAGQVVKTLDTDGDGNVSWDEFQAGLKTLPAA